MLKWRTDKPDEAYKIWEALADVNEDIQGNLDALWVLAEVLYRYHRLVLSCLVFSSCVFECVLLHSLLFLFYSFCFYFILFCYFFCLNLLTSNFVCEILSLLSKLLLHLLTYLHIVPPYHVSIRLTPRTTRSACRALRRARTRSGSYSQRLRLNHTLSQIAS